MSRAGATGGALALASAKFPADMIAWVEDPEEGGGLSNSDIDLDALPREAGSGKGGGSSQVRRLCMTDGQKSPIAWATSDTFRRI